MEKQMLRILKWAYKLGVRQERERIKILIAESRQEIAKQKAEFDLTLRDPKTIKEEAEDIERLIVINYKVDEILDRLTRPRGQWVDEGPAPIDGDDK